MEGERLQDHIVVGTGGCVLAVDSFPAPGRLMDVPGEGQILP